MGLSCFYLIGSEWYFKKTLLLISLDYFCPNIDRAKVKVRQVEPLIRYRAAVSILWISETQNEQFNLESSDEIFFHSGLQNVPH